MVELFNHTGRITVVTREFYVYNQDKDDGKDGRV